MRTKPRHNFVSDTSNDGCQAMIELVYQHEFILSRQTEYHAVIAGENSD